MRDLLEYVIVITLCINFINFSQSARIGTVSDKNAELVEEKYIKKREATPDGGGEFYPDWVPFKNKHGDELGEFEQVKKSKPKKRLALPLNFAFVRPPREAKANEDYYDRNGDSEDYYEKREWSDISRQETPISPPLKNKTKENANVSDIDTVINIINSVQPGPYLNKIHKNKDKKVKKVNHKKNKRIKNKEKQFDNDEDYEDVNKIVKTPKPEPPEPTKTVEELKEEAEKKAKIFREVDELKARHASEQKKMMRERTNEDVIFEEEFEREHQNDHQKQLYPFNHPKAKKLTYEDSDEDSVFIDKYELPRVRPKKRKTTTRQTVYEDILVTEKPKPITKEPEDKEEYEYLEITKAEKDTKEDFHTIPAKEEEERIVLVPDKESQDGEPTLFFAKKKKKKYMKKERIVTKPNIIVTTTTPTTKIDTTTASTYITAEDTDSDLTYVIHPVDKTGSPTTSTKEHIITKHTYITETTAIPTEKETDITTSGSTVSVEDADSDLTYVIHPEGKAISTESSTKASATTVTSSFKGDSVARVVTNVPPFPSTSGTEQLTSASAPSASSTGPSASSTILSTSSIKSVTGLPRLSTVAPKPSRNASKTGPSGADALEKILSRLYHTSSPNDNVTVSATSATSETINSPSISVATGTDISLPSSIGIDVTSPSFTSPTVSDFTSAPVEYMTTASDKKPSTSTFSTSTSYSPDQMSRGSRKKISKLRSENVEAAASINRQSLLEPVVSSSEHKKNEDDGPKEFKKGGGKEYHAEHEEEHEEHGKKAYEGAHENTKSAEGHHEKEDHQGDYHDYGGIEKGHHDESGHHGTHHHEEAGKKHAKYEESGKHSKGHSTKGSHDVHKKDEYEKKVEFFEEEGDSAEEENNGGFHNERSHSKGGKFKKAGQQAGHDQHIQGKGGYFSEGNFGHGIKGYKAAEGHDAHGKREHSNFLKGGAKGEKKWIYHHGSPPKNANLVIIDRRGDKWQHGPIYYG